MEIQRQTKDKGFLFSEYQYQYNNIWVFPNIGVPQNGWFTMVPNPIKMDDLGGKNQQLQMFLPLQVAIFQETVPAKALACVDQLLLRSSQANLVAISLTHGVTW